MTETPRTDARVAQEHPPGIWSNSATISTDFARAIERELNQWKRVAAFLAERVRHIRPADQEPADAAALAAYEKLNWESS